MLKLISDQPRSETWIAEKTFNIGSDIDNHLTLQGDSIALFHARIVFDGQHHWLKDLNSASGTYVNDQRISQRQLHDGDRLRFGDQTVHVADPLVPGNQTQWCLVANSGWLSGRVYPLPDGNAERVVKIGRGNHCDIVFPGTHLAREHVEIQVEKERITARSLKSNEGVFINDRCIQCGEMRPGDILRLDVHSFSVFGPLEQENEPAPNGTLANMDQLAEKLTEQSIATQRSEDQKQWVTRSTSPGNRDHTAAKPAVSSESFFITLFVVIAIVCLAGLGVYLWMG